jgi:hypothetical protein
MAETDIDRHWMGHPFWVAFFVLWILMVVVAVTLALALGIWNLWQAF